MVQLSHPALARRSGGPLVRALTSTALTVSCALLIGGCAGGSAPDAASSVGGAEADTSPSAATAPPRTVQQLAATVGCTAELTTNAADYRQATCKTGEADYVLLDFDTAEGQRAWLDYAQMYGGVYLVGDRWALSAKSKEYMESLRATIGGTVEEKSSYGAAPTPSNR
ncbi:hypothetical protein BCL76_11364 [Streptomyces sp. CG 926]|uniref:hypothetical protein n=1 Tax=Streptomyces sp. CG 926 TaxID=1882405 RepID=UPI000D7AFB80|nr:hypothetical protein [Streptomyces sp. CG 926]PWK65077.1 hypothetical protein BCL76_11364 [Streptomyces sp. CG 926]